MKQELERTGYLGDMPASHESNPIAVRLTCITSKDLMSANPLSNRRLT